MKPSASKHRNETPESAGEPVQGTPALANGRGDEERRSIYKDLWGGFAAAAVVVPQAVAFGIALYTLIGRSAAEGALAGLFGAAALSLASGCFGGTAGLISSPTGPALALLTGALAHLRGEGLAAGEMGAALALVIMGAGVLQILVALSGGGNLIKLIPYPVVAGFTTGAAFLMFKSQLRPLLGEGVGEEWISWRWLPPATALTVMIAMHVCLRLAPRLPATVVGLCAGAAAFFAAGAFSPEPLPAVWRVGELPGFQDARWQWDIGAFARLPLTPVLAAAAAFAMLASLNNLLTSVLADAETGLRHDGKRELLAQGVGQMLAGAIGGMGGSATTGASLVAVKSGGRRWAGAFAGLCFLGLVLFMRPLGNWLPLSALAGIILYIALNMIERDILAWLRHKNTRVDGLIALLVTLVTVVYQLVIAIGLGVVIAVVAFIYTQMKAPIIHRRTTGQQHRSARSRGPEERAALDRHGHRIVLYELRGSLFFAKVDQLFEQLLPDLHKPAWIVLDLQRVTQVDLTGVKLFQQIAKRLDRHGGELLFSQVHKRSGLSHQVDKSLQKVSPYLAEMNVKTFIDADEALEYAENRLLRELNVAPAQREERIELENIEICSGFAPEQLASLKEKFRLRKALAGQHLFTAGDWGDELFLVARGEVEIRLRTTNHHYLRLGIYGPGSLFGEIAFHQPGQRAADAVATCVTELWVLDREGFDQLAQQSPDAAIALLLALGQVLGTSLRWSAREIHHLAQW
jgi:SulP family sulfate permease